MNRSQKIDATAVVVVVGFVAVLGFVVNWERFRALLTTHGHMLGSLVAIVFGVVLGMLTTNYRERGQNVDDLNIRRNKVQAGLNRDQVPAPFRAAIEECFIDVEEAIRDQSWGDGNTALSKAEAVWDRWRKYKMYWELHLASCDNLVQRARKLKPDTEGVQRLLAQLETVEQDAVGTSKAPPVLRAELAAIATQIDRYEVVYNKLSEYSTRAMGALPATERKQQERDILRKLRTLDSTKGEDVDALVDEIEEFAAKLPPVDTNGGGSQAGPPGTPSAASTVPAHAPAATSRVENILRGVQYAEWRRHLFALISHAITVILLTQVGFRQLYLQHADEINGWTFSNVKDVPRLFDHYVALVLWGFSSEASRRVVTEVFRTNRPQSDGKSTVTPLKGSTTTSQQP